MMNKNKLMAFLLFRQTYKVVKDAIQISGVAYLIDYFLIDFSTLEYLGWFKFALIVNFSILFFVNLINRKKINDKLNDVMNKYLEKKEDKS